MTKDQTPRPTGTVTFLLTDVEGSTRLWQEHPDLAAGCILRQREVLTSAFESRGGYLPQDQGEGDSVLSAFSRSIDAVEAAMFAQQALAAELWPGPPIKVRMAIHCGDSELFGDNYLGLSINRTARLRGVGHGGQVLLSQAAASVVGSQLPSGASLKDLGLHRLKDLSEPERAFQLLDPTLPADFPPLVSLDAVQHNLPIQLTSFVGRTQEVEELKRLVTEHRLVTLMGPGGVGKTRLSIQTAAELTQDFPQGVWLVELESLTEPDLLLQTVAGSLQIKEEQGVDAKTLLADKIGDGVRLMVLDNCEHLIDPCAQMVEHLLSRCANLRVIATSRELLNIAGEATLVIPSLSFPKSTSEAEQLVKFEATSLFLDRCAGHRPGWSPDSSETASIVEICRRLDGLPLAIELAAARLRTMSVTDIAAGLENRFRMIAGGRRTALPRQQTLRALVDWSYDLLAEEEKTFLCRLSIFPSGFGAEAVSSVCFEDPADEFLALEMLMHLVDKSLVVRESGENQRFRLLETIRHYAFEKLAESRDAPKLRATHAAWMLDLAKRAAEPLLGPAQGKWLDVLDVERESIRLALDHLLSTSPKEACLLAGLIWPFWLVRGTPSEGRKWLGAVLEAYDEPDEVRARALNGAGQAASYEGSVPGFHEEALAIFRRAGDSSAIAETLQFIAARDMASDHQRARDVAEESLALAKEAGDQRLVGTSLMLLAISSITRNDYVAAEPLLEDSLSLTKQHGDSSSVVTIMSFLANLKSVRGDTSVARQLREECLVISRGIGDLLGEFNALSGLTSSCIVGGLFDEARKLILQTRDIASAIGEQVLFTSIFLDEAEIALSNGEFEAARDIYEKLFSNIGSPMDAQIATAATRKLGLVASRTGDFDEAHRLLHESLDEGREQQDKIGITETIIGLGTLELARGNAERAASRFRESAKASNEIGWLLGLIKSLEGLAVAAGALGMWERAETLLGWTDEKRISSGMRIRPCDIAEIENCRTAGLAALGAEKFDRARSAGGALSMDELIEYTWSDG